MLPLHKVTCKFYRVAIVEIHLKSVCVCLVNIKKNTRAVLRPVSPPYLKHYSTGRDNEMRVFSKVKTLNHITVYWQRRNTQLSLRD